MLPALAFAAVRDAEGAQLIEEDTQTGAQEALFAWVDLIRDGALASNQIHSFWLNSEVVTEDEFRGFSRGLLRDLTTLQTLSIVDENGTVRWAEPTPATEGQRLADDAQWSEVLAAASGDRPVLSGWLERGGFALVQTVETQGARPEGWVVVTFGLPHVIESVFAPTLLRDYTLQFYDKDRLLLSHGSNPPDEAPTVVIALTPPLDAVRLLADPPTLTVRPSPARYEDQLRILPAYVRASGVLVGIAMGVVAYRELGRAAERTEARRRMVASEAHYRSLFETAGEMILVLDLKGRIGEANARAAEMLGLSTADLVGREFVGLGIGRDSREFAQTFSRVVLRGTSEPVEGTLATREGGELAFFGALTPLMDENGTIIAVRAHLADVTSPRRLEREVREANDALRAKVRELDSFVHTIAHDLKNPLRAVSSYADFLAEDYRDRLDAEGRNHVDRIRNSAARMREMLDALLGYARAASEYPFEKVETQGLMQEVLDDLRPLLVERSARVELEGDLPPIRAQRIPLKQVFVNLIGNAVKHNDAATPEVRVRAVGANGSWDFVVEDNGPGVPPTEREHIFDLFAQGRSAIGTGGTGVGLAIVKRIVEGHGGEVWVDAAPSGGAAFHVTIPARLV